jgi:hypothetical protein
MIQAKKYGSSIFCVFNIVCMLCGHCIWKFYYATYLCDSKDLIQILGPNLFLGYNPIEKPSTNEVQRMGSPNV